MVPVSTNGYTNDPYSLFVVVLCILLIVWTSFADKVSEKIREQMSSTIGRIASIFLLYLVYRFLGFIPALLFTMGISLTWLHRPLSKPVEGFLSSIKKTPVQGDHWFVERVLGENPVSITEDRVDTAPVQDNSDAKNSKTSR
jgi:hypothetical protein